MQGQQTPDIHLRICDWLADRYAHGNGYMLLMAFRGCGKSTLVGLFAAWLLRQNPALRILVVSADEALAERMVRNVRRIIERHPLTRALIPPRADQWAADRFTVARDTELREPSMIARGIMGNLTGLRADLLICDDVEVPNTADSAGKREELRARLQELNYIRAAGARTLYVGTPHAFDTIYATVARDDIPAHTPFLLNYDAMRVPVIDAHGNSAWPEKFPMSVIDHLRITTGLQRFQSQMMLEPVNVAQSRLNPALLVVHDHDVVFSPELQQVFVGDVRMASASAWWDPAFGRAGGDASVLAVVFTDMTGGLWVQNVTYLQIDDADARDEAQQQCVQVAEILKALRVPVIGIETNGIGRFLPAILRREMVRVRAGAAVVEVNNRAPKAMRILQALETPLAARMIHLHRNVTRTPLLDEMRDWVPGSTRGHDDGLDALAGAILMEPVRLPSGGGVARPRVTWRGGHTFHARTE